MVVLPRYSNEARRGTLGFLSPVKLLVSLKKQQKQNPRSIYLVIIVIHLMTLVFCSEKPAMVGLGHYYRPTVSR
jgi:hypothetical protein